MGERENTTRKKQWRLNTIFISRKQKKRESCRIVCAILEDIKRSQLGTIIHVLNDYSGLLRNV